MTTTPRDYFSGWTPQPYTRSNILINGDFRIDQRGKGGFPTSNNEYTFDRWHMTAVHDGVGHRNFGAYLVHRGTWQGCQVNPETAIGDSNRITITQRIEADYLKALSADVTQLTLSFKFFKPTSPDQWDPSTQLKAIAAVPTVKDNFGPVIHVASTSFGLLSDIPYETLKSFSWTFDLTQNMRDNGLAIELWVDTSDASVPLGGGVYSSWGEIKLEAGSKATPFVPRPYAEELALCQRYYEKSYEVGVAPGTITGIGEYRAKSAGAIVPSGVYLWNVRFNVPKRAVPACTIYSPITGAAGQLRNISQNKDVGGHYHGGSASSQSINAGTTVTNAANAGDDMSFQWVADAEL